MEKNSYHENIFLILLLLIALILRCHQITMPFIDAMGIDGTVVGNMVRNFLRYNLFETNFGIVTNAGPVIDGNFNYSFDHPMHLFVSILSASCGLFGMHEWSMRIVPVLFSAGNLIMIYMLAGKVWDKKTAFLSMFFMAFMPMSAFYTARDVWPYSMGIFLSLIVIWFYVSWVREYKRKHLYGAIIIYSVSLFTLWDIYFLGPILFLYHILSKKKKLKWSFIFPLLSFVVFTLILVHTYFLLGSLDTLWNLLLMRTGGTANVTFLQFASLESYRSLKYFTAIPCLLAVIGIWHESRNGQNRDLGDKLFLFLFAWGIPFSLLFQQGAMHQVNWICTWSPFIALSAARGLIFLEEFIFPRIINNKNLAKRFCQLLSILAILGCVLLALHKSGRPDIGPYSLRFFSILIAWTGVTMGLVLFTWRILKYPRQDLVQFVHPLTIILLVVFLSQSLYTIHSLYQKKGFVFDYKIARTINKNSEFEDAVMTSISLCHYCYQYYADRYVVDDIRTTDDYLAILKKNEKRSFRYFVTPKKEIFKKKLTKNHNISGFGWFNMRRVPDEPCELDEYMSRHFEGKVYGPLIIYDLSRRMLIE